MEVRNGRVCCHIFIKHYQEDSQCDLTEFRTCGDGNHTAIAERQNAAGKPRIYSWIYHSKHHTTWPGARAVKGGYQTHLILKLATSWTHKCYSYHEKSSSCSKLKVSNESPTLICLWWYSLRMCIPIIKYVWVRGPGAGGGDRYVAMQGSISLLFDSTCI